MGWKRILSFPVGVVHVQRRDVTLQVAIPYKWQKNRFPYSYDSPYSNTRYMFHPHENHCFFTEREPFLGWKSGDSTWKRWISI